MSFRLTPLVVCIPWCISLFFVLRLKANIPLRAQLKISIFPSTSHFWKIDYSKLIILPQTNPIYDQLEMSNREAK